jgi:hypothetical protein
MIGVWALLAMVVAGLYLGVAAHHGTPPTFRFEMAPIDCPVLSDISTCYSLSLRNTSPTAASLICTSHDTKDGDTVEFDNALHEFHTGVISAGETRTLVLWVTKPAGVDLIGVPMVGCTAE